MTYFADEYGFNENEVTALLGAHTMGGAFKVNSGYTGMWLIGEANFFNTKYYEFLLGSASGLSYTNERNDIRDSDGDGDRKWQWNVWDSTGTRVGFMLNT